MFNKGIVTIMAATKSNKKKGQQQRQRRRHRPTNRKAKKAKFNKKPRKGKHVVKKISFKQVTKQIKNNILDKKPKNFTGALKIALKKANQFKNKIRPARVIPVPKQGGILPLIPIFAGLSALGALSGGAAGIAKAVNDAKAASKQLQETQRHNQSMEAIALGKGICLKRHKKGLGLFLRPPENQRNYP